MLVAQGELFGVMVKHHHQPATAVGPGGRRPDVIGAYFRGEAAMLGDVRARRRSPRSCGSWPCPPASARTSLENIGLTVFNMAWIPLLGGLPVATLKLPDGRPLVVAVSA